MPKQNPPTYRISSIGLTVYLFLALLAASLIFESSAHAFVLTCENKEVGTYDFGESPYGCNAELFGDVSRIQYIYEPFVFKSGSDQSSTRTEYVKNIVSLIKKMGLDYLKVREPNASAQRKESWIRGLLTVATHESFMSHYRIGRDGKYKLMMGDKQISHGMMQINQRYHQNDEVDNSFDLVGNIMKGIEIYYLDMQRAKTAPCIKPRETAGGESYFASLNRAAYSNYNGGPGSSCRWTKKGKWSLNDENFLEKLQSRLWRKHVAEESVGAPPLNVTCLLNGDDLCAVAKEKQSEFIAGRPLVFEDGRTCLSTGSKSLLCTTDIRSFICMDNTSSEGLSKDPVRMKLIDSSYKVKTLAGRIELCQKKFPELISIGEFIEVQKDIRVRDQVGGQPMGVVKRGQIYQVLDFETRRTNATTEHYYKIRLDDKREGYVTAGLGGSEFIHRTSAPPAPARVHIPTVGSRVEIVLSKGIKLLKNAEGPEVGLLAKKEIVTVREVKIAREQNEIRLTVESRLGPGVIYVGRTHPELSVSEWVKVLGK